MPKNTVKTKTIGTNFDLATYYLIEKYLNKVKLLPKFSLFYL